MNVVVHLAPVLAKEARDAAGLCNNIESFINVRVKFTHTKCLPVIEHGAVNFLLISEKPLFSVESLKKAWLIWTVGAVGTVMNAHQNIKSSDVFVSDTKMRENCRSYKYPVALAQTLQRQVTADQIDIEDLYEQLNGVLVLVPVPR